ncbi:hypothetical protein [Ferviditalea candida]|uniref:Uncharacterized protein n=1 Tax=Ferviditalea candida TaxID=3108399 RepID=A0ABU5ZES6_9BACL|nr:hypothetical protein [Paenibacillaceae bacterium T2]
MGTSPAGTSMSGWNQGMWLQLNHFFSYQESPFSTTYMSANGHWADYTSRIDNDRPVGIRFDWDPWVYYSYHFVTGTGYDSSTGTLYFGMLDPDGGQYNTGVHWVDWSSYQGQMNMGLIWYRGV